MEKKKYGLAEAARMIGIKPHRLKYAITNRDVKDASSTFLGKRVFTEDDIQRLREHFQCQEKKQRGNDEV